jgi:6-phosphogluconolactonase
MSIRTSIAPDPDAAARACAAAIAGLLKDALADHGSATLALSGGSTPRLMMDHLSATDLNWSRVHIFFVDERPVPPGDPQSNYTLCEKHLLEPAGVAAQNVHRIQGERPPEEAAELYRQEIYTSFGLRGGEKPRFDAIQCGVGPDCHTASLFPGEPAIDDMDGLVAALPVAKMAQTRITVLPAVLLNARNLIVLATGAEKAEAIGHAVLAPYNPMQFPAQLVVRAAQSELFLDTASAALAV